MCILTVLCSNFSKIVCRCVVPCTCYLCICFLDLHYTTQLMIHFHIEDSLLILHWITIIEINLEITLERKEEDTFLYWKFKIWMDWIQKMCRIVSSSLSNFQIQT